MNVSQFTYLLQKPETISAEQTRELEIIIREYPYFQAARALQLKGLRLQDSFQYNQTLKTTAAYTSDRSVLFDFITSKNFEQHEISKKIAEQQLQLKEIEVDSEEIRAIHFDTSEDRIKEAEAILDPDIFQPVLSKATEELQNLKDEENMGVASSENNIGSTPESILQLGKPLTFTSEERHSFTEWLQLTRIQPIERETETTTNNVQSGSDEKEKKFGLIDKFLKTNPKIEPKVDNSPTINLAKEFLVEKSQLMTETLAKVYLEQKNIKKQYRPIKF